MGEFRNTTLGNGVLTYDGVDVGFLKGDVKLERKLEQLPFESGVPLQTRGTVITKEIVQLTAPMAEITPANLSVVSGTIPLVSNAGTAVVVGAPGTARTFASYGGSSTQKITLLGPITSGPVVKDAATGLTTYTAGTDYVVDAALGEIYRNPAGSITSLQAMLVTYSYTIPASTEIRFGKNFVFRNAELLFTHVSPVDGKAHTVRFWVCQTSGDLDLTFSESAYVITNCTFLSIPDPVGHPNDPTGYYRKNNVAS